MQPAAFSCSSLADRLASQNSSFTSLISSSVISLRPFVLASTHAGVSNCTQQRRLVTEPISPSNASASGESLMLSVEARMARIFMSSSRPQLVVLMMSSLSSRSTGMPWGEIISVPRMVQIPRLVARTTMGARVDSRARLRKVKHSMSSMCTSSTKSTPGTSSAIPWSMQRLTTLLISPLSFSVTSVFFGFMTCPIRLMKSLPPWGRALAISKSCRVTSCTISFFLCTSPLGRGTYSSAQRSNSLAQASQRPTRLTLPVDASMQMTSPMEHFSRVRFSWMEGSSLSCLVPLEVLRVMMTLVTILLPEAKSSRSSVFNSVISPSHTSFVSLILMPIDLRKFSISTSVFFTSEEKTSDATMGQKGTLGPSSCAMANAMAVLPVPGGPARSNARPAIFLDLMRSTATPAASLASTCPTMPWEMSLARPSSLSPRPLMWVCVETRWVLVVERTSSICVGRGVP